jgi:hypothetical protein
VAAPEVSGSEVGVAPSTESERVPVGTEAVVVTEATVRVMVSAAPEAGVVVAAVRVVEVESRVLEPELELGQRLSRLKKSMEPRPEASS